VLVVAAGPVVVVEPGAEVVDRLRDQALVVVEELVGGVHGRSLPSAPPATRTGPVPIGPVTATLRGVTDIDAIDFFLGDSQIANPYPYFEALRARCPVTREPHHDVVMVTGYDEAVAVYNDTDVFSSCTAVTGPFPGSRCRSRATTSATSSPSTATSCPSATSSRRSTLRCTPTTARS